MYIPRDGDRKTKIASRGIIVHNHQLFLVQHKASPYWSLPGGKLDDNEDMRSALSRELIEELGINAHIGNMQFINEFRYGEHGAYTLEFFFAVLNPEDFYKKLTGDFMEAELDGYGWHDIDKLPTMRPAFLPPLMPYYKTEDTSIQYFSSL